MDENYGIPYEDYLQILAKGRKEAIDEVLKLKPN